MCWQRARRTDHRYFHDTKGALNGGLGGKVLMSHVKIKKCRVAAFRNFLVFPNFSDFSLK